MKKIALTLTAAALMLAGSLSGLSAQQGGGPMMQDDRGRGPSADVDRRGWRRFGPEMMGEGGMPGYGMMMGAGMMGDGMMRMMLIVMDTDGDDALSLEEFQAVHERIFAAMDIDKDGKLTFDEMEGFIHGDRDGDDDDD